MCFGDLGLGDDGWKTIRPSFWWNFGNFSGVEKHQLHRICSISEKEKPCYIRLMLQKSGDFWSVEVGRFSHDLQGFIHPRCLFGISEPSTVSWNLDWLINKDPYNDQWKINPQHSWTSCSSPIRTQTTSRGPLFIARLRLQKLHFPYIYDLKRIAVPSFWPPPRDILSTRGSTGRITIWHPGGV